MKSRMNLFVWLIIFVTLSDDASSTLNHQFLTYDDIFPLARPSTHRPIFLLHGLMNSSKEFHQVAKNLTAEGFDTIPLEPFAGQNSLVDLWTQSKGIVTSIRALVQAHEGTPRFDRGYDLLGFSQGALLARAVAEIMDDHEIHTLVCVAGPQMGIYIDVETDLSGYSDFLPQILRDLLYWFQDQGYLTDTATNVFYSTLGQQFSVGNMWHAPYRSERHAYLFKNVFLPVMNNLVEHDDDDGGKSTIKRRRTNFLRLKEAHFIYSPADEVILPPESSVFGFYQEISEGQHIDRNEAEIVSMYDAEVYLHDTFGLQTLDRTNRLFLQKVNNMSHHCWNDLTGCGAQAYDEHIFPLFFT